uniref:Uncharacterized protein n=1 Tax=Lepeophtheirus salmonis TaxID=72036 RepID=A0A0K2T434_LEPSM
MMFDSLVGTSVFLNMSRSAKDSCKFLYKYLPTLLLLTIRPTACVHRDTVKLLKVVEWNDKEELDLEKEYLSLEKHNVFRAGTPVREWLNDVNKEMANFSQVVHVLEILETESYSIEDMVFLGTQVDLTPGIWEKNHSRDDGIKNLLYSACSVYDNNDDCFHLLYFMAKSNVKRLGLLNHIAKLSTKLSGLKLLLTIYNKESKRAYGMDRDLFKDISHKFEACNFCGFYYMDHDKQKFLKDYVRMMRIPSLFEETEECYKKCHIGEYPVIMVIHKDRAYLTSQDRIKCNHAFMKLKEPLPIRRHTDAVAGLINDTLIICDSGVVSFRFQGRGMSGECFRLQVNSSIDDYEINFHDMVARIIYDNINFKHVTVYQSGGFIIRNTSLRTEGYTTSGIFGKRYITTGNGHKIWMTGGYIENYDFNTSTTLKMTINRTYVFQHMQWSKGPDLPMPLSDHCVAEVNSTHSFVAGGFSSGEPNRKAWIYAWWEDTWTELTPMPSAVPFPRCSKYTKKGDILIATLERAMTFNVSTYKWLEVGRPGRLHTDGELIFGGEDVGTYLIGGRRTYKFTGEMWIELHGWYNNLNANPILASIPIHPNSRLIPRCFPTI